VLEGVRVSTDEAVVRMVAVVHGDVQGVGFRWWTRGRAEALGLRGSATNRRDGRVEVAAEGRRADCADLVGQLSGRTPGAVSRVDVTWLEPVGEAPGFRVG
jgi:acylphosphatase